MFGVSRRQCIQNTKGHRTIDAMKKVVNVRTIINIAAACHTAIRLGRNYLGKLLLLPLFVAAVRSSTTYCAVVSLLYDTNSPSGGKLL